MRTQLRFVFIYLFILVTTQSQLLNKLSSNLGEKGGIFTYYPLVS